MKKITQIKLLDTGYLNPSLAIGSQTQAALADRAGYTGATVSAFTLDTQSSNVNSAVTTENKPVPDSFTETDTSLVSSTNRIIAMSCRFQKDNDSGTFNKNDIHEFLRMERTPTLKIIYPSDLLSNKKPVIEYMGAGNIAGTFSAGSPSDANGTVSTTTPYLVGLVKGISVSDKALSNWFTVTFNFELSKQG